MLDCSNVYNSNIQELNMDEVSNIVKMNIEFIKSRKEF